MNYLENIKEILDKEKILNIECNNQNSDEILMYLKKYYKVSLVRKNIELYDRLRVNEHLKFFADLYKNKNYKDIINLMDLSGLLKMKCGQLTYSQKKRVEIALMLLTNPQYIFIQEPLTDLDESSYTIILRWLGTMFYQDIKIITTSLSLKSTLLLPGVPYTLTNDQLQKIQAEDYLDLVQQEPISFTKISAKVDDKIFLFDPNDISYAEAQNSKTVLYVRNSLFQCQFTLDELEAKLKRFGFYRCHRSYLVNMQKVEEVIKWTKNSYSLKLRQLEDMHVPLSKGRIDEMMELYRL